MEKVALVGALLLQQVSEESFGLLYNSSDLRATVWLFFRTVVIV